MKIGFHVNQIVKILSVNNVIWTLFPFVLSASRATIWLSIPKKKDFNAKKSLLWYQIVLWSHKTKLIVILVLTITFTMNTPWVANLIKQIVHKTVKCALRLDQVGKDVSAKKVLPMMYFSRNV